MSEEEKKANDYKFSIPIISNYDLDNIINYQKEMIEQLSKHIYHDKEMIILQRIILNQQKEIEELKTITNAYNSFYGKEIKFLNEECRIVFADSRYFENGVFKTNFVSKQKIKDKIEELEKFKKDISEEKDIFYVEVIKQIKLLKELLEYE